MKGLIPMCKCDIIPKITWIGPRGSDGEPCNYHNIYVCDKCDTYWEDHWSCACDDDCPVCGATCCPSMSHITDLKTGEVETVTW